MPSGLLIGLAEARCLAHPSVYYNYCGLIIGQSGYDLIRLYIVQQFSRGQTPGAERCPPVLTGRGRRSCTRSRRWHCPPCFAARRRAKPDIRPEGPVARRPRLAIAEAGCDDRGFAVTERGGARCLPGSVTGLPLRMGHGRARRRFGSWLHPANFLAVGRCNSSRDELQREGWRSPSGGFKETRLAIRKPDS